MRGQHYNYVSAYGDPLAHTPNIDGLARAGILFTNAHSAAPVCAPARSTIITGVFASSLGTQNMRSNYPLPREVKYFPEYLRAAGYYCTNNAKTDYNTSTPFNHVWNENGPNAHWRNRAAGQPFFAVFNFNESHESMLHKRVPLITDPAKVHVPAYLPDAPEVRADIAQYYDCVGRSDQRVGAMLKQLADDGLAEDTIVFYYSDNGGCLPRSKRFLFDNGTHIAMALYFPPKYRSLSPESSDGRNDQEVGFVDLAPTVLNLVGLPIPAYMQGRAFAGAHPPAPHPYGFTFRNRMDERDDFVRALGDGHYRYIRNYRPDLANGRSTEYLLRQASMREWVKLEHENKLNAAQRVFFETRPPEQLFDCQADPENVHDLAADSAQHDLLLSFRAALRAQLLEIRDTGFMPEPLLDDLAHGGSPTTVARDNTAYPLAELIDTVDALQLGPPAPEKLAAALASPLPVVRYWGVITGMGAGKPGAVPLLRDPNATVRLAAAEAVIHSGRRPDSAAWLVVTAALAPSASAPLRLAAANIVADYPDRPAAAVAALEKLPALEDKFFDAYYDNLIGHIHEASGATAH